MDNQKKTGPLRVVFLAGVIWGATALAAFFLVWIVSHFSQGL